MSDSILDEVREILQKSPTIHFDQGYVIGLVAELEAIQGVLSRVQEARVGDIDRAEKAEAENARLTKMVDWLADKLSDHCLTDGGDCNITICPTYIACRNATPEVWKEAANRAVAESEGNNHANMD